MKNITGKSGFNIFLPGLGRQLEIFFSQLNLSDKHVLIIGSNSEEIALRFIQQGAASAIIIVDEEDSLFRSKYLLASFKEVSVRFMEYHNTDFKDDRFDVVYAQASISVKKRNKILKEVKRILKPGGIFCAGEVVNLERNVPQFIKDLRSNSGIEALYVEDLQKTYLEAGLDYQIDYNLSSTLKEFYKDSIQLMQDNIDQLQENEKSYYKKTLHMISHESNAYLKLGGEKFMGYKMIIVRKRST